LSFYALVGDIGGTNARFALIEENSVELHHVRVLNCADYDNFDDAYLDYYQKIGCEALTVACISFACPIAEHINMTNNHWSFDVQQMQEELGLSRLELLNDFTAMAYGSLFIDDSEKILVQAGNSQHSHFPRLVLGPGTGLGVGSLVADTLSANQDKDGSVSSGSSVVKDIIWQAIATEGGHVSFAPTNALEIAILQQLLTKFERVSVERILSGDGILQLYLALCTIKKQPIRYQTPAQITAAVLTQSDPIATQALDLFCSILGALAGDLVLAQGTRGGVFLCGGILPRIQEFFLNSSFMQAMINKGRFNQYLSGVPVWLCNAKYQGLIGSAAALKMMAREN
jgi:glucokinase